MIKRAMAIRLETAARAPNKYGTGVCHSVVGEGVSIVIKDSLLAAAMAVLLILGM